MPGQLASVMGLWREVLLMIGGGAAAIVVLAAMTDRRLRSALWQRTIWRAATLALLAMVVAESTGAGPGIVRLFRNDVMPDAAPIVSHAAAIPVASNHVASNYVAPKQVAGPLQDIASSREIASDDAATTIREFTNPSQAAEVGERADMQSDQRTVSAAASIWVPGIVWMIGAAAVFLRLAWSRIALWIFRRRCGPLGDESLRMRVESLAERLGVRRPVRVSTSSRLDAPVVFGALRPLLVVPSNFARMFDARQQEAILAHELAHLAGRDPFWMVMASIVTGLLWWHPLVWWSKRRLRAASEAAADEASRVVPNGPCILAETLVLIGQRLVRRRSLSWLSVEGSIRSGLGRRVERLLDSHGETWRAPRRGRLAFAHVTLPIAFTFLAIFSMAWAQSRVPLTRGETTMSMLKSSWKSSLAATALCAILASDLGKSPAQDRPPESEPVTPAAQSKPDHPEDPFREPATLSEQLRPDRPADPARQTSADRQKLRAELQAIKVRIADLESAGKHDEAERLKGELNENLAKLYPGRSIEGRADSGDRSTSPADLATKIQHLHVAAENLKAAGFDQEAQHIAQMIERLQIYDNDGRPSRDVRAILPNKNDYLSRPWTGGGDVRPGGTRGEQAIQELQSQLQQMQNQMREMQEQIKRMADRSPR